MLSHRFVVTIVLAAAVSTVACGTVDHQRCSSGDAAARSEEAARRAEIAAASAQDAAKRADAAAIRLEQKAIDQ